jgi:hypothetical protein
VAFKKLLCTSEPPQIQASYGLLVQHPNYIYYYYPVLERFNGTSTLIT